MRQLTVQEREALMADMRSFDEPEVIDIYHGSPKVIEQPVFGAGKVHNDYGRGFYCTEHAELAKEWACSSDNDGYANRRTKQEQRPSSLGLCLARRRKTIVNHYQLETKGLTVLKSKKAFEALTFVEAIKASRQEYFAKYKQRDEEARGKYRQIASKPLAESEIYVIDIIRNNWKNGQGI